MKIAFLIYSEIYLSIYRYIKSLDYEPCDYDFKAGFYYSHGFTNLGVVELAVKRVEK